MRPIKFYKILIEVIACLFFLVACQYEKPIKETNVAEFSPNYDSIQVIITKDTIKLAVDSTTSNRFAYFNCQQVGNDLIFAFLDLNKRFYHIYDLKKEKCLAKLDMRRLMVQNRNISSTKVFFKNFDSIYVYADMHIFLVDSLLTVRDSIKLLNRPFRASTFFINGKQPVFLSNVMYAPAFPTLDPRERKDRKKWRTMYKIDWSKHQSFLLHGITEEFVDSIYDKGLLSPFYSYDRKKQYFVFSLPADSSIEVTDFKSFAIKYPAGSKYIKGNTSSYLADDFKGSENSHKALLQRNTYGQIYHDTFANYYLRVAEQKITDANYISKRLIKDRSLIILDSQFKIVGESIIDHSVDIGSLLVTPRGIYAPVHRDAAEDTIYLVRLDYSYKPSKIQAAIK
ncbi:DUF4221 family protein [Chitinophaga pinensis]|uniref:DUF4221 domain-containing protein n=1 Tax=Chitinophaga pinensis (strain ATCC 43595 / DSM 2588 / LMG 13176 / NBRC 15968 / NCIMB 11800 / UQM 2034) TaxID=485918 RepID=A0A979GR26_CHIPD|nr:DUF4221 family protein [Chitinophaga pinensis]ACU60618.1 hypothetical protein Cpin_3151 [Chitinophaga pinensis DSM 2588]